MTTRPGRAEVDAAGETLIDRLLDYLRQPSVSATGEGFPEATDRAAREMELAGLAIEIIDTPGRPAVVGHRQGPAGTPTVLLYGHYDVQPAGPRSLWDSEPFEPEIRDGRIFARGSGDNKGQHFAHLQGLRLHLEREGGYPCSVIMLLDGEEELGSPNLPGLIRDHRDDLACDLVIWSDRSVHESGRWCVLHGVRGILKIKLTARGASRPLHSGHFGNVAPNPAWELTHALASLRDPAGRVLVAGFYDDVEPLPEIDRAAFAALPLDLDGVLAGVGLDAMDPAHGDRTFYDRLAAIPALTINGIDAGDMDRTIIPDVARAGLDVRLVAGQRPEVMFDRIAGHLGRHAPGVEVTYAGGVPPSRTPLDNPHTELIAGAIRDATGEAPLLIPAFGGTLPDHVWPDLLGVPSVGLPLAGADQANHAPNENLEIDRYLTGIVISMRILQTLGQPQSSRR